MSEADDQFLGDLAKTWERTRETIESFANEYLSAAAEERKLSGPELMAANVQLAGRMWLLGLESMSVVVKRVLAVAKDLAPPDDKTTPAAGTPADAGTPSDDVTTPHG